MPIQRSNGEVKMQITDISDLIELFAEPWFLVFAIPILGAFFSVFIGRISNVIRQYFSIATIGASALLSAFLMSDGLSDKANWREEMVEFIPKSLTAYFGTSINLDPLGVFVALIASGLGFLIAVFSLEYMKDDEAETRYWFFIQLFVGGMVLLVLAGDLISLYFGWKIVGVCSYFLIGHWFHRPDPQGSLCAKSGIKAFLMTLVGDIALLAGLAILWLELQTINIAVISANIGTLDSDAQTTVALLILLGAVSKSAQFPLITWLSSPRRVDIDAMQGPTTVSALIHAATMVKAGVYLMSRFYFVFAGTEADAFFITLALIAAITAFIAAASALVSIDIKRILAYSTVSQLAYMFMGLAIGYLAYSEEVEMSIEGFMGAQFHLMSHAIFKALLFLSAGAIIHSLHGERNIKKMGGLKADFPVIHIATLIGVCALAGIPLFSGFFSKETILGSAIEFGTSDADLALYGLLIFAIGAITALLTAIYAFRFFFLIFYGEKPEGLEVHPAGPMMRGVTGLLALLVIVSGFIGPIFLNELFEHMFPGHDMPLGYFPEHTEAIIGALATIAIVILGVAVSYYIYYQGPRTVMPVVRKYRLLNACHIIAREGFYLDALYQGLQDLFMWANWKLRKLQTGDLNYNMSLLGLVGLTLAVIVLIL